MKPELHICDVCQLLDNDDTLKMCVYCGFCEAWFCSKDRNRPDRRALAATKRKLQRMTE
jgi:hypothetical protein